MVDKIQNGSGKDVRPIEQVDFEQLQCVQPESEDVFTGEDANQTALNKISAGSVEGQVAKFSLGIFEPLERIIAHFFQNLLGRSSAHLTFEGFERAEGRIEQLISKVKGEYPDNIEILDKLLQLQKILIQPAVDLNEMEKKFEEAMGPDISWNRFIREGVALAYADVWKTVFLIPDQIPLRIHFYYNSRSKIGGSAIEDLSLIEASQKAAGILLAIRHELYHHLQFIEGIQTRQQYALWPTSKVVEKVVKRILPKIPRSNPISQKASELRKSTLATVDILNREYAEKMNDLGKKNKSFGKARYRIVTQLMARAFKQQQSVDTMHLLIESMENPADEMAELLSKDTDVDTEAMEEFEKIRKWYNERWLELYREKPIEVEAHNNVCDPPFPEMPRTLITYKTVADGRMMFSNLQLPAEKEKWLEFFESLQQKSARMSMITKKSLQATGIGTPLKEYGGTKIPMGVEKLYGGSSESEPHGVVKDVTTAVADEILPYGNKVEEAILESRVEKVCRIIKAIGSKVKGWGTKP